MPRIRAVIFDLDDTLISEAKYQQGAHEAVLEYLETQTGIAREAILRASELAASAPRAEYFQTLLPLLDMVSDADTVRDLVTVHREHSPRLSLYPDVLESFRTLRAQGLKLGVITDGHANVQRQKLAAVDAEAYVDAVLVSDELGREYWKPHEKTFLLMADMLGVGIAQLMYVGDNPEKDFFIASSLPITTIRINREDSLKANYGYLGGVREHYSISTLSEIQDVLYELIGADQYAE